MRRFICNQSIITIASVTELSQTHHLKLTTADTRLQTGIGEIQPLIMRSSVTDNNLRDNLAQYDISFIAITRRQAVSGIRLRFQGKLGIITLKIGGCSVVHKSKFLSAKVVGLTFHCYL
ncbi:hypothetical protein TNIN_5191 [Trichonephila inaurata madagascariensis]|uniref:Uncharacterized protein n=1 Tax=Trichonephila inaurata madagascariensis TaxID=2747483 RepID=A0A8X6XMB4_9ARAC|nr:hypothetical protein TNIN_5191 [Trichonephila inaurata madagascariensis]